MVRLRHLYSVEAAFKYHFSSKETARVSFDHSSSKLDSLQTLHQMCACQKCLSFLVRTPNLRKLGLTEFSLYFSTLPGLNFLKCLETLSLDFGYFVERMELPLTVKRLTFKNAVVKSEAIPNLPNLEVLKFLHIQFLGSVWNTSEEAFPKLKYLRLCDANMEEWNASKYEFPRLEVLVLEHCRKLKQIPIDFGNLNELRKIMVMGCTQSVEGSAREIQVIVSNIHAHFRGALVVAGGCPVVSSGKLFGADV
ncbi:hypothetical protein Vadar_009263 [Vaccinium darrowii]|uniref:Uncharacterized protein n=1 Tax=Vaccinium darrowii TaxID=229202 RepID=A0ACB7XXT4_9ERIC|nr:hypothetical protein Vadar_009263 [Vaccinium darrowii]